MAPLIVLDDLLVLPDFSPQAGGPIPGLAGLFRAHDLAGFEIAQGIAKLSDPGRLSGACARLLNGSNSNSRWAGDPSLRVAVMPAIAASVSSATQVMTSSISRRLSSANSWEKL